MRKKLVAVMVAILIGFCAIPAEANLTWSCTHWRGTSVRAHDSGGSTITSGTIHKVQPAYLASNTRNGISAYCSSATISGSISASIPSTQLNQITSALNAANSAKTAASAAKTAAEAARDAARAAESKIGNAETTITNKMASIEQTIADINIPPTITKIQGVNGATATTTNSFDVAIQVSGADQVRAGVNGAFGGWTTINQESTVSVNLVSDGAHTITVQARNSNYPDSPEYVASGQMMVFKL